MRILGIDPGIAIVGFGLINAENGQQQMLQYGAITTQAGLPLSTRLYQIGQDFEELIGKLQPDATNQGKVLQHQRQNQLPIFYLKSHLIFAVMRAAVGRGDG